MIPAHLMPQFRNTPVHEIIRALERAEQLTHQQYHQATLLYGVQEKNPEWHTPRARSGREGTTLPAVPLLPSLPGTAG